MDEKIKILDETKKRKLSCRTISEKLNIGKSQAANVMKNESKLRMKNQKRENHQRFKVINEISYTWYKKCEAYGIYVNGPLPKEEAMNIKSTS